MNSYEKGLTHKNTQTQLGTYQYMFNKLNLNKNDTILDVGCSDGVLSKFTGNRKITGIDINKKQLPKEYSQFILCDVEENIPLEENSYNISILNSLFQHLNNPQKAFENILKITKKIVIFSPNFDRLFKKGDNLFPVTKYSMQHLANVYGLKLTLIYISNKLNKTRKLIPKYLAGGIIAIFEKPKEAKE